MNLHPLPFSHITQLTSTGQGTLQPRSENRQQSEHKRQPMVKTKEIDTSIAYGFFYRQGLIIRLRASPD